MRLLLDVMCGGVVSYLRMCNHDTVYAGDRGVEGDDALLEIAQADDRTLVTRDVALANRAADSILLESRAVETQLAELADAGVELTLADAPAFCGRCNGSLERIDRTASTPEYVPETADIDIWRCRACGQHFWRGSHWDRVADTLAKIDGTGGEPSANGN